MSVKDFMSCSAHVLNRLQTRFIAGKIDGYVETYGPISRPILDFSENITFASREESIEWKKSHPGYIIINIMKLDEFHNRYVIATTARKRKDGSWCYADNALCPVEEY